MLRNLARWTGFSLLAVAMALGVVDGARSVSVSGLSVTALHDAALWLLPQQYPLLEPAVVKLAHPFLWDPVLANIMRLPAFAFLFATGGLLMAVGSGGADEAGER
jgi:hypothetical protein